MLINYAFIDENDIVQSIAVFNDEINTNQDVHDFAKSTGYKSAVNCKTYGQPYVGDKWDVKNLVWIEITNRHPEIKSDELS